MKTTLSPLPLLATIAERELGTSESPRGSNRGPDLGKYFVADDYRPGTKDEGYPWCAAFVSWCVQELYRSGAPGTFPFPAPRTARAFGVTEWAKAQGENCLVFTPARCKPGELWPQRGDIAVFRFSHVGIVVSAAAPNRHCSCVEGNTDSKGSREGWEVAKRARVFGDVREFIRMIPAGGAQ